jgi:hypothetical protein
VLGNLEVIHCGAHKSCKFRKYASQYLRAFCYSFNRRFDRYQMVVADLVGHVVTAERLRKPAVQRNAQCS